MRRLVCVVLLTGAGLIPPPAAAQERLFMFFNGATEVIAELGTTPDTLGAVKRVLRPDGDYQFESIQPVAGGRYLALTVRPRGQFTNAELRLLDTRTGQSIDTGVRMWGGLVTSDPRRPRLFLVRERPDFSGREIVAVTFDPLTVTSLEYPITSEFREPVLLAATPAGDRLVVGRTSHAVDVVDPDTGQLHRTIAISPAVSPSASDHGVLYFGRPDSADGPSRIHAVSLVTGEVVASAAFTLPGGTSSLVLDQARRRLLVVPSYFDGPPSLPLAVLNADTLALEATVPQSAIAAFTPPPGARLVSQAHLHTSGRNEAYFAWLSRSTFGSPGGGYDAECLQHTLTRLDATTGAVLARADMHATVTALLGASRGCNRGQLLQLNAPSPPTLSAAVEGSSVTLTWTNPGNTAHFDLEAGSAPGLRNLLATSLDRTTLTVDGVPPGTYYLRARAINEIGRSLPSHELRLVVP